MNSHLFKCVTIFSLLGSIDSILAKRLMFDNGYCSYNREIFSNFSIRTPDGVVHLDGVLVKPLVTGLRGHLSLEFRTSKTKSFQNLLHYDLDYCKILKATKDTLSRRWYQSILKNSNFSTSCPVQPGYAYVKGWRVEGNLLPSFMALGDYRIEGTLYYGKLVNINNKPVLRCTVQAHLVE